MRNAHSSVKSKCISPTCKLHSMNYDDRPDFAKRLEKARIERGFDTAKDAARYFGWTYETYIQHEQGIRGISRAASKYAKAFRVSEAWLLTGEGDTQNKHVPIMGYLGAGAEVEPDFEQVPPEGLDQIEIPFPLPEDMIGFKVRGDSMLPAYKDGAIIVVYREQQRPLTAFYGEEAAVRTSDGRRFIKTIMRGQNGSVNLLSWNANPIEGVYLDWIGEIFAVIPPSAMRKVGRQGGIQGSLKL